MPANNRGNIFEAALRRRVGRIGPNDLPFDPVYESEIDNLRTAIAQINAGQEFNAGRLQTDFLLNKNRLGENRDEVLKNLEQRLADQGILRSGINIAQQADIGKRYQDDLGDLTRGQQRGLEDLTRDTTERFGTILGAQRTAASERIRRYTEGKLESDRASAQQKANAALIRKLQRTNGSSRVVNRQGMGSRQMTSRANYLARMRTARGY